MQSLKIGDCIQLMKELPPLSIDLILSDPPYNVGKNYSAYNDNLSHDQYLQWSKKWFNEAKRVSKSILFTPGYVNLKMWLTEIEYPKGIVMLHIPNQNSSSDLGGWNHYEPLLVYGKTTMGQNAFDYSVRQQHNIGNHPCPKGTDLFIDILKSCRPKPQKVLDPFAGSGTTLRACRDLNIDCIGFEIDPSYKNTIECRSLLNTPKIALNTNTNVYNV